MAAKVPLPNFLIIGAHRSATRWLRVNLNEHPDIFMCARETGFYSDVENMTRVYSGELPDYRKYFDGWDGEEFIGESDPSYFRPESSREVAWRIYGTLPDVKLILLLRNPVDRYFSALYDAIKKGDLPGDTDLNKLTPEVVRRLGIFPMSVYEIGLGAFQRLFLDRIHIEFFDDIESDPDGVYSRVLEFLGADTSFRPAGLEQPTMYALYANSVDTVESQLGRKVPASWRRQN